MNKSGGVATNIGVHFFDLLSYWFGKPSETIVIRHDEKTAEGIIGFNDISVHWFLSIDESELPLDAVRQGKKAWRKLNVDDFEIDFSEGFEDLHTESYRQILMGNGYRLEETRNAIELIHQIRNFQL